jgi:hypothetical protein
MKEDSAVGGSNAIQGQLTPKEAREKANAILGDFKHPYYNAEHPSHRAAVEEVQGYFKMASI